MTWADIPAALILFLCPAIAVCCIVGALARDWRRDHW